MSKNNSEITLQVTRIDILPDAFSEDQIEGLEREAYVDTFKPYLDEVVENARANKDYKEAAIVVTRSVNERGRNYVRVYSWQYPNDEYDNRIDGSILEKISKTEQLLSVKHLGEMACSYSTLFEIAKAIGQMKGYPFWPNKYIPAKE